VGAKPPIISKIRKTFSPGPSAAEPNLPILATLISNIQFTKSNIFKDFLSRAAAELADTEPTLSPISQPWDPLCPGPQVSPL
jgi:hypothetical protein